MENGQVGSAGVKMPRNSKGKRPQFFEIAGLDEAMSMIMVLASELSVLRDRLDAIEIVGKENGIDFSAEIEKLKLSQCDLERREAARQSLLSRLYYLSRKDVSERANNESVEAFRNVLSEISEK